MPGSKKSNKQSSDNTDTSSDWSSSEEKDTVSEIEYLKYKLYQLQHNSLIILI